MPSEITVTLSVSQADEKEAFESLVLDEGFDRSFWTAKYERTRNCVPSDANHIVRDGLLVLWASYLSDSSESVEYSLGAGGSRLLDLTVTAVPAGIYDVAKEACRATQFVISGDVSPMLRDEVALLVAEGWHIAVR